ncbi:MAG: hypothetical protein JW797_16780 [Bradymonadales bacterium]|nr:hypothetical protein [Bradymonadales bacterium]
MANHADWLSLVHLDGLVVSEPVLEERFPGGPQPVTQGMHYWFRRQAERYRVSRAHSDPEARATGAHLWIDFLLEQILELPRSAWLKAGEVPDGLRVHLEEFSQELRPDRVLMRNAEPVLPVAIVPPDQGLDRRDRREGRWKASPTTKLDRLLRETGNPLGLVTNGDDFRLVHAQAGLNTGHITWSSRILVEEKATLDAFYSLLGRDLLLPANDEALTLADLCRISQDRQIEVADQLGVQVRNGLERLIWAWDAADRATDGRLLGSLSEDRIYEMGLVVMMRLVFLLYAEERNLLPHGEVLYDQGYGLTYLWHRLLRQKREDPVGLAQSHDAWNRFIATCRLVHRGCSHPDLSLLAYGGRLFDPARFEVLEHPDCKVTNRTLYEVLHRLLFARQSRGGDPQRVGYWSIDVEQIGYIYEGLLDHRCARAGDVPVVKLRGAGEASLPVVELERLSRDERVQRVVEETGRKEDSVREALDRPVPSPQELDELAILPPAVVERVRPFAGIIQCDEVVPPGWRFLTTGKSRRASGAHYTPQSLTERIVRATLEPLVYRQLEGRQGVPVEPREVKTPRELLALKVCDIAMGSGAFLVQAVRYLGDRLVEAWDRALVRAHEKDPAILLSMPHADPMQDGEGDRPIDPEKRGEMILWARRYVVERCIYGVDVNPLAVEMAKLSLWLTTLAKDRPFTFLDHALRCGDSLVGVDLDQLRTWSLDRKGCGLPAFEPLARAALDEALSLRQELERIAVIEAADSEHKQALHEKAEAAIGRVRLAADLIVAPCFAEEKAGKQAELRDDLLNRFSSARDEAEWQELAGDRKRLLSDRRTFHWPLEFPEVFLGEVSPGGGFDAIVGNPPFVGGQFIRRQLGERTLGYLRERWPQSHGTADLVAFFFLRAFENLRPGGAFGLIATNTIGQGDTRESGLDRIAAEGGTIYQAVPRMPWPGLAAVNVSVVHVCKGPWHGALQLDGQEVATVSTSLDASGLSGTPERLAQNQDKSFQGSNVLGLGFTMSPEEARALIEKDPKNAEVLFPYLNGKDLNTSPDQSPSRWVINFLDWPLEKAEQYPDCMAIVREKVKPERMGKSYSKSARERWWQYERYRPELYRAIAPLERVLVVARVSRTVAFVWVPKGWVYNEKTIIFATANDQVFSVLQSAAHTNWAWKYSSTLKTDLNYAPSDCFETFPFPQTLTDYHQSALERIGEEYHEHRRRIMLSNNEGLTKTYNRFHDPESEDEAIWRLRELQVEMDNAVRDAYGWTDLALEHTWAKVVSAEEVKDRSTGKVRTVEKVDWRYGISERAKNEVLRRLLELNHRIHREEAAAGLPVKAAAPQPEEPFLLAQAPERTRECPRTRASKRLPPSAQASLDLGVGDLPIFQLAEKRTAPIGSGTAPVFTEAVGPKTGSGTVPISATGVGPEAGSGTAPVSATGVGPEVGSGSAPVSATGLEPPAGSGTVPISAEATSPPSRPNSSPTSAEDFYTSYALSEDALSLLQALRQAQDWQSKAQLLALSGIEPGRWTAAINRLLDAGLVERQGEKRGARYRSRR